MYVFSIENSRSRELNTRIHKDQVLRYIRTVHMLSILGVPITEEKLRFHER